jgi:citrate lyase beta subunit
MSDKFETIKRGLAGAFKPSAGVWRRQPVHTVYGGAQLFRPDTAAKLGRLALRALEVYAPDPPALARALGVECGGDTFALVYQRIREKLAREPVEDYRIDFEDGYGIRADAEEDAHAAEAARHTLEALDAGSLPPFFGIRIKPLSAGFEDRALRTLDIFLRGLGGRLPQNFVVTLPKAASPAEPAALAGALEILERENGLPEGAIRMEIMVESAQALMDSGGCCPLNAMVEAARGRCSAAHFGPFDFTSSCGVTSKYQDLRHPLCDYARQAMQVALAGSGVFISDGPTAILPTPLHQSPADAQQQEENRRAVHAAWRLHFDHIWNALRQGIYQGWDLHPAQLPVRYAAVYLFFLSETPAVAARLRNFLDNAAQATLMHGVFDDAASGQGLLNFLLRAANCGAIAEAEVPALTGIAIEEFRTGSIAAIMRRRVAGS